MVCVPIFHEPPNGLFGHDFPGLLPSVAAVGNEKDGHAGT